MLVPLSWLTDYVDVDRDVVSLAEGLSDAGLKVEAIHRPGADVDGVIVAEVLSIAPHPNADKLAIVEVSTGVAVRRVVCGAQNFAVGDRVPLALPGARLPGGVTIERSTIRGETSDGMLCSARELGLGDDHSGILVLPAETEVGAEVTKVLGLDEVVLEIEVTPNRPDAMSMLGIAREVAALTGSEVRLPKLRMARPAAGAPAVEDLAGVVVEDASGCPRYLARVVTGVIPGPSPDWVQRRLSAAGVPPISNIGDATKYAPLVTGHPPNPVESWTLTLRPERVNLALGTDLTVDEMCDDLRRLGLHPVVEDGTIKVTVPTRRPDLRSEVDLIEEIARLTGYDRIPARIPAGARVGGLNRSQRLLRRVRTVLAGAGLFEAYTSSLIGPGDLDRMGYPSGHEAREALRLTNALGVDESLLRPSLLPGLVSAAARNVARRNLCVRLFEIGRCFVPREDRLLPDEPLRLGMVLTGPRARRSGRSPGRRGAGRWRRSGSSTSTAAIR